MAKADVGAGPAGRRSGQRSWRGAAGSGVQHRKQQHRKQQCRSGGRRLAGWSVALERRRRQRRFGFYGHHDRLIVGGHVPGHDGFGAKWWLVASSGSDVTAAVTSFTKSGAGTSPAPAATPTSSRAGGGWS